MKTILIIVSCLLLSVSVIAQTPMLKGVVLDEKTSEPIPFANVYWCDGKTGATTDMEGNFLVADSSACDTLIIAYLGYVTNRVYVPALSMAKCLRYVVQERMNITVIAQ